MPYIAVGKTVYKKNPDGSRGKKVGTTKGDVHKYLAALHAHSHDSKSYVAEAIERKGK